MYKYLSNLTKKGVFCTQCADYCRQAISNLTIHTDGHKSASVCVTNQEINNARYTLISGYHKAGVYNVCARTNGHKQVGIVNTDQEIRNDRYIKIDDDDIANQEKPFMMTRKLTPLECFRVMGVYDEDAKKIISKLSKTACYAMAGNSIVVDVLYNLFNNMKFTDNLKVFTAFSGYDSQCLALNRTGIQYELVGWSEIDKCAIQAHNILFPQYENNNYGDISKIDWSAVPDFDLFTYSSPCQDFSQAGQQRGGEEGSGTRSSLLWECRRAIEAKRPKMCVMENVKALTSKKFMPLFVKWIDTLTELGYKSYWKVLDAQDYGVPQHRERVFLVSFLDHDVEFEFPKPMPLTKKAVDVLENEEDVDPKYYIDSTRILPLIKDGDRK